MCRLAAALCGIILALPAAAPAQTGGERPVVVELYTSQGCSSCPPADAVLAGLALRPEVIALSLHVDYWDYLGWKDRFGQARFTERQKSYARAIGDRTIYTPQMIVGGTDRLVGSHEADIDAAIARHAAAVPATTVRLTVTRSGDGFAIRAERVPPTDDPLRVDLVRFLPEAEVAIERGENAGRTIVYHNVVTSWERLAEWTSAEPVEVTASDAEGEAVVLVQSEGPAGILAAARLP
jgi:hypothetical protein